MYLMDNGGKQTKLKYKSDISSFFKIKKKNLADK